MWILGGSWVTGSRKEALPCRHPALPVHTSGGSWRDPRWILDGSWVDPGWILGGSWMRTLPCRCTRQVDPGWILVDPRRILDEDPALPVHTCVS